MGAALMAALALSVERLIGDYGARFPNACARALNRAATSTRAVMARGIAADVGLKVGATKDEIKIEKATGATLVARLSVSGIRLRLIDLAKVSGPEPSKGRGAGVRARFPGGAGRYPHAFLATVGTGRHRGVFERKPSLKGKSAGAWGKNLPIRELRGPSLPKVFEKVTPEGLAAGEASLITNLRSELRFATGGGSIT